MEANKEHSQYIDEDLPTDHSWTDGDTTGQPGGQDDRHTEVIRCRISRQDKQVILRYCEQKNVSLSDLMRTLARVAIPHFHLQSK